MPRCGHDLEVVVPFPSPIVDARVAEVMEGETFNSRLLTNRLVDPSDVIRVNGSSISMKNIVTTYGPHLEGPF